VPEALAAPARHDGARTLAGTAIAGLGTALPATAVPNAPIAERIGVDPDWIVQRTGIHSRHVASAEETLVALSASAGAAALADAGIDAAAVDLVLVATSSSDDLIPNAAPLVAGALGADGAGGIDVGAACTGFVAGMQLASAALESGRADVVLLVGADCLSRFLDPDDRRTAMLFGDGAGAMVLTRAAGRAVLGPVVLRCAPARDLLFIDRGRAVIQMEGQEVFKHAVARMTEATREASEAADVALEDIDLFVYHQANGRIIRSVGQRLGLDPARVVDCIGEHGNTSAASIPLALAQALGDGRLREGARVLLAAFGAGFVWGGAVIEWRTA
jgi:3-oxoacyl-[acyl-carrier-protein] synthase-3